MSKSPLLVFDFDGVIVDGMAEYWSSSLNACISLMKGRSQSPFFPALPPHAFVQLRPWVEHGWEMVLLAAELSREDSYLVKFGAQSFSIAYKEQRRAALDFWGWQPDYLRCALEDARRKAIDANKDDWFSLHRPYPWVLKRLDALSEEGIEWAVLTTKGADFASELLGYLNLTPTFLFGHESGSKYDVLKELISHRSVKGFIEDRRETLEKVLANAELSSLSCYLASWGYLKPGQDDCSLPHGIRLLRPETMAAPLAAWT